MGISADATGLAGADDRAADGWADGFGVVAPDVARYASVVRALPNAVELAMRNLAARTGTPVVDGESATLASLLVRGRGALRVVELGTGTGYLTLHLARALDPGSLLVSVDDDPDHHGYAHELLGRAGASCALELRLAEPARALREVVAEGGAVDVLVLGDPAADRLALLDQAVGSLADDALVLVPFALLGGRVADPLHGPGSDEVDAQRALNRAVATDPRFTDVMLLPVGDGLVVARRASLSGR